MFELRARSLAPLRNCLARKKLLTRSAASTINVLERRQFGSTMQLDGQALLSFAGTEHGAEKKSIVRFPQRQTWRYTC